MNNVGSMCEPLPETPDTTPVDYIFYFFSWSDAPLGTLTVGGTVGTLVQG